MSGPEIRAGADPGEVARIAADAIEELILAKPDAVLALPTGRTPRPLYDELVGRFRSGRITFRDVQTFNLDEWVGVPPESPASYAHFMDEHIFRWVDLAPENRHLPNGMAPDLDAECRRYDETIRRAGGLDLAVLGIGRNGHIGFNEPGTSPETRSHVAWVAEDTRRANAYSFPDRNPPSQALTMGIATIIEARSILLLATGDDKADILTRSFTGPIIPDVPASVLQRHAGVVVVGDRAALRGLLTVVSPRQTAR